MRLWTLHPRYLDSKGLVAAWREALLAQKVLSGGTRGYRHHPQLLRFRKQTDPTAAIATFLAALAAEAKCRGYEFDAGKIAGERFSGRIPETRGQLLYEWTHLQAKLKLRAAKFGLQFRSITVPEPHPLFRIVPGKVRAWEKTLSGRPLQAALPEASEPENTLSSASSSRTRHIHTSPPR